MLDTEIKFMGRMPSPGSMEERLGVLMPFIASFHWADDEQKSRLCTMTQLWAHIDLSDFSEDFIERTNYEFVAYIQKIGLFRAPLVAVQTISYDSGPSASQAPKLVVQFEILLDSGYCAERTLRRFEQNPPNLLNGAACTRLVPFQLSTERAKRWAYDVIAWADPLKSGFVRHEINLAKDDFAQALSFIPYRHFIVGQNLHYSSILRPYPGIPQSMFTSGTPDDATLIK
ncbi:hypothetical protein [Methylobacterium sp. Leaf93]|uniref:hypothetical protein n=1 Tax=Methylobacterium sp. Leaf93 TaxID=1736249 RepID=UPI000ADF5DFA|nr:hypothetical protein [Methylobacterium sp. Leaf93]